MKPGDYASLPIRIRAIYDTCPYEEQKYLIQILTELSNEGVSPTYDKLWLQDYKEIPVDLDTFLCDERYLGLTNRGGEAIYPYWKDAMHEILDSGNRYTQCIFTGATRIGKTSTAITCAAYMLYKMMCFRDPQKFFQKKEISQFSLLFFNLTLDLARSVAFREFNDTLKMSPWFCAHGTFSKSERNSFYIPEGGKIVVEAGSDVAHSLGKQVFCIVGDTIVKTNLGRYKISDLYNMNDYEIKDIRVLSKYGSEYKESEFSGITLSDFVNLTIRVYLDDENYFEGTPDHRMLMYDGTYRSLHDISPGSKLMSIRDDLVHHVEVRYVQYVIHNDPIPVYDILDVKFGNNFSICCGPYCLISHNCAVLDEVNFAKSGVKDIQKAKARIKEIYDSVVARVEGTFRQQGEVYGKIFAVSSKKTDSDFIEDHVSKQLSAGNDHLISFDKPQWEVLPPDQFNKERFYIAVGDRHKKGFVVNDDSSAALDELRNQGYELLEVPVDLKSNFLADFDIALRDIAGIAVPGQLSFITQYMIDGCVSNDRKNPFYQDVLEIGTRDSYTIEEFFHLEFVDKSLFYSPMYIDVDLSLNDDKTGISGVAVTGRKEIKGLDNKVLYLPSFTHVFSIAIKAPLGDKIPYSKITAFIIWLRRMKFNIDRCSRDQYQSEYMGQLLEEQGFKVDKISVDRTPDGYNAFRDILLDKRIDLLDIDLLQNELINLQRDGLSGKIDHKIGQSKDMSDSLVRATWNAILNDSTPNVSRMSVANAVLNVNRRSNLSNSDKLSSLFPDLYRNVNRR